MSTKKAARKSSKKASAKAVKKTAKRPANKPAPRAASKSSAETSSGMANFGQFNWNELMTSDANAATAFYTRLFGWKAKPFGHGMDYTLLENNGKSAGGLMKSPEGGPPPMWLAYVTVVDIDATVAKLTELGGSVCKPPFPIPGVGRIAIVQDPQGATFGLHSC